MKTRILSTFIFILTINTFSQNLIGTKWINVHTERTDGSTIHYRGNVNPPSLNYYFKSLNKIVVNNSINSKYKIDKSELTIGFQEFTIEKLNDTELIISEKGGLENTPDDKKKRFYFIESRKIMDYLIENKSISFLNDSTINSIKYFKPKLKNKSLLSYVVTKHFSQQNFKDGFLIGAFHINTLGKIDSISITKNSKISRRIEVKFKKYLRKIDFIPIQIDGKNYNQFVPFNANFKNLGSMSGINIFTNINSDSCINNCGLSLSDTHKVEQLYVKGNLQVKEKNIKKL